MKKGFSNNKGLNKFGTNMVPYHLMKLQRNPQTDKDTTAALEKI